MILDQNLVVQCRAIRHTQGLHTRVLVRRLELALWIGDGRSRAHHHAMANLGRRGGAEAYLILCLGLCPDPTPDLLRLLDEALGGGRSQCRLLDEYAGKLAIQYPRQDGPGGETAIQHRLHGGERDLQATRDLRLGDDPPAGTLPLPEGPFRDLLREELPGGTAFLPRLHLKSVGMIAIQDLPPVGGWNEVQTHNQSRGDGITAILGPLLRSEAGGIVEGIQ
jgi:hypothetical protein